MVSRAKMVKADKSLTGMTHATASRDIVKIRDITLYIAIISFKP